MTPSPEPAAPSGSSPRPTSREGRSRHHILLGLIVGAAVGLAANHFFGEQHPGVRWLLENVTEPAGVLFLRLLLMIVVPLVFSSLIIGLARLGNIRQLGRVGLRCFLFCLAISGISVAIGISLANLIRPGERVSPEVASRLQARFTPEASKRMEDVKKVANTDSAVLQIVKTFVPSNPLAAIVSDPPNMLHWMFFTVLLGVALMLAPTPGTVAFINAVDGLYAASAKIIDLIMRIAPFAVACLLFSNTARFGLDVVTSLGWFVVAVAGGLALHMFGTYSLALRFMARVSPWEFFRRIKSAMVTAFSTSSSNASLPTTLRVGEEELGIPKEINSFVLTIGATANQNGTALYEGVTVLFLAQLAGVDLSLMQQITVAGLAILGSIGTAGVPSGSIPFIIIVLGTINVNPLLIGVILGVDRLLDMCRTTLNVAGDLTVAAYVARAEGYPLMPTSPRVEKLDAGSI